MFNYNLRFISRIILRTPTHVAKYSSSKQGYIIHIKIFSIKILHNDIRERAAKQRSDGISPDYLRTMMQVVTVFYSDFKCDCDQNIRDISRIYIFIHLFLYF
jgi:hypothetical protein